MATYANPRLVAALRASKARAPILTEDDVPRQSVGDSAVEERRDTAGPRRLPVQRHPLTVLLLAAYTTR